MDIPDLRPDLSFHKLAATPEDIAFSFAVKRAAMGPHIIAKWGWDEALQRDMHAERYREKPFFAIMRRDVRLGVVSFQIGPDHCRFGKFYLFPAVQGQGMGTRILRHCLELADAHGLPVRLEHLIWSPVGSLYRRQGFEETARSEVHCFMERRVFGRGG